jgi:type I restriction enzyme S subunit
MVPAGEFSEYIISQSQMRLRVNEKVANPRFVYFACTAPAFMEQIRENAISTGVPHINLGILSRLTIPWFHLGKQRAIVEVLGALDDKIAVNDGIGRTTDKLLAALFSRLCIGATWGTLNDIAIVNAVVTRPVTDGSLRYVDISSVSVGNYELPPVISWDEAPSRARRVLKAGDTVWSTVRPNRRSHALILDDDASLIASTGLAVLSPNKGRVACVYESTRTAEFVRYLESVAEGSAYPAVRGDRFNDAPVPALCNDKWDRFESMALPLRKRAYAAARETRSLAITRDELLPLLMSGKVCVRDVEKIVEEVV